MQPAPQEAGPPQAKRVAESPQSEVRGPYGDLQGEPRRPTSDFGLRTSDYALRAWRAAGVALLAALVTVQTVLHLDERSPFLYLTAVRFAGERAHADGYVTWLEGHPTWAESWQLARQAGLYAGAGADLTTGLSDARAAYAYLGALLARPLGYFGAFVVLNAAFWLAAALATWYLARALLGAEAPAFLAALLAATGQGFAFLSSTPMSYVAGYAWGAVLLALACRWRLFGRTSGGRCWLRWGWLCGVAGLFYFTHVVLLAVAWLFGARRAPARHLFAATAVAMALPVSWYLVGHHLVGLRFDDATAADLLGELRRLAGVAAHTPALLPSEAGHGAVRALVGGFSLPLLALAALGVALARPRRRAWYLAVALCGLAPALVLHMIPVTQRYGYLAYPAIYVAAAEGAWWLAARTAVRDDRQANGAIGPVVGRPPSAVGRPPSAVPWALGALLALFQLIQANADVLGSYRFALAFGAP